MSYPSTVTVPAVAGIYPVTTRIVVVLPAPLGPKNPQAWPGSTVKEISSTAVKLP